MVWPLSSSKKKYCLTINKYGVIDEHKTFKGFKNVKYSLDRKENFNMADGGKLIAKVPLSWKKSFSQGVVIPHKMKNCSGCTKDILCDSCDKLVNQNKEFSANLNELKREPPNESKQSIVLLSNFSKIIIDTKLKLSTYTNILTSYLMIYHTLL